MPRQSVWKGSKDIHQSPGSPEYIFGPDGDRCILKYEGPFETLMAQRPKRGVTVKDAMDYFRVISVKVKHLNAGKGEMQVEMAPNSIAFPETANGLPDAKYETEWVEIERAIESNPIYASGGSKELTDEDLAALKAWENEDSVVLRKDFKYREKSTDAESAAKLLSDNAKHLAKKKLRGQSSYKIFAPVARRTTYHATKPDSGNCGKIASPPVLAKPDGTHVYLKNADRVSGQKRNWQKDEEWLGADEWDTDFYS